MAKKKQTESSDDRNKLNWDTQGDASATLFFSDASAQTAINVSLMPGYEFTYSKQALIGDAITSDDIIDLNGFEQVLLHAAEERRFIRVKFVNRSETKRKFELAFLFNDDETTDQRYEYEIEAKGSLRDRIDVKIVR